MRKFILVIVLGLGVASSAYAQFSSSIKIDSLPPAIALKLSSADFNNDNKEDIILSAFQYPFDRVKIYTNLGNNQFSSQYVSSADSLRYLNALEVGDLNADGKADFVTISGTGKNTLLHWYENQSGNFIVHFIDTLIEGSSAIILKDFDKDGKLDILLEEHHEITLRYQEAQHQFSAKQIVHSGTEFYAIDAADYNNDGYLDVSVASGGFDVVLNNQNKTFTVFSNAGIKLSFGIQSADLDMDNDIDIAIYESVTGIMFYENDGQGNFTFKDTILYSSDNFQVFNVADLDCDYDIDVYTSITQIGKMVWMENDGAGDFSSYKTLHTQAGQLVKLTQTGDFNGDGKTDLIWANKNLGLIINQCISTSIEQQKMLDNIAVFPNPYSNSFYIENKHSQELYYNVFDLMGVKIKSGTLKEYSTEKINLQSTELLYIQVKLGNELVYYKLLHTY